MNDHLMGKDITQVAVNKIFKSNPQTIKSSLIKMFPEH